MRAPQYAQYAQPWKPTASALKRMRLSMCAVTSSIAKRYECRVVRYTAKTMTHAQGYRPRCFFLSCRSRASSIAASKVAKTSAKPTDAMGSHCSEALHVHPEQPTNRSSTNTDSSCNIVHPAAPGEVVDHTYYSNACLLTPNPAQWTSGKARSPEAGTRFLRLAFSI